MSDARLDSMSISHPSPAARLMLEHKGIDYHLVNVPAGMQAAQVRLAGFKGGTVPALRIDGRRAVGTLAISRVLDAIRPEPPLFPVDPAHRRAVEKAEAWGERVLQPIPRRVLRWALHHHHAARTTSHATSARRSRRSPPSRSRRSPRSTPAASMPARPSASSATGMS